MDLLGLAFIRTMSRSTLSYSARYCDFWGSKPIPSEGFDLFVAMHLTSRASVFVVVFLSPFIYIYFSFLFFAWSRETPRLFLAHDQDEGKCRDEKTHTHTRTSYKTQRRRSISSCLSSHLQFGLVCVHCLGCCIFPALHGFIQSTRSLLYSVVLDCRSRSSTRSLRIRT